MPAYNNLPAAPQIAQQPLNELFDLSTEELLAKKNEHHKSNNRAFWLSFVSLPGMFVSGIVAFYELSCIITDKLYAYDSDEAIKQDLKVFVPSAAATAGFFGAYKYAQHRMNKTREQIESIDEEIARRQAEPLLQPF